MIRNLFLSLTVVAASVANAQKAPTFLHGGDVSEIPEVEAAGGHYSYGGSRVDPFALLKSAGWNFVRFRVWNDPKDKFCDKAHTLAVARRAKKAGLAISIDFHYSDWWADPGKQVKPAAWKNLSLEDLAKALHDYTKDVVQALVDQGTPPIMVQVGNEIRAGMLWPEGRVSDDDPVQWKRLGILLKAGLTAVREVKSRQQIQTMIHLDTGADPHASVWWFDHAKAQGIDFDLIGLSYYPFWHGHMDDLQANLNDLAKRYGKPVYVAETAYPWTFGHGNHFAEIHQHLEPGYAATPEGQAAFLRRVVECLKAVPNNMGRGILYWAPMWISTPGHDVPWDTLATFDTDGAALPGVDAIGLKKSKGN